MVLDYLLTPRQVAHKPWDMLFLGSLFVSFGMLVEIFLPSLHGSIVIFAMVPAIPLLWSLLVREEKADEGCCGTGDSLVDAVEREGALFRRHADLIGIFAFFFLGAVISYALWFAFLPQDTSSHLFADQLQEVSSIRGAVSGWVFNPQRAWLLFTHNAQVLALMFLFCLVYGVGSIYLLLWNASIIGVFIGEKLAGEGLWDFVDGFFGLLPHGSLEVAAYFVASVAGGIISVALMRGKHKQHGFRQVLVDVSALALLSIILVAAGALLEGSY